MQEPITSLGAAPADMAERIAEVLSEKLAQDTVVLDLSGQSNFADHFVVTAGENERHLKALRDAVDEAMAQVNARPLHIEGTSDSGWILMDYGSVVVHLFSPRLRSYYNLEKLWGRNAPVVHFA